MTQKSKKSSTLPERDRTTSYGTASFGFCSCSQNQKLKGHRLVLKADLWHRNYTYTFVIRNWWASLIDHLSFFNCGLRMKEKEIQMSQKVTMPSVMTFLSMLTLISLFCGTICAKIVIFRQSTDCVEDLTILHYCQGWLLIWLNQVRFLDKDQSDLLWNENWYKINLSNMIWSSTPMRTF